MKQTPVTKSTNGASESLFLLPGDNLVTLECTTVDTSTTATVESRGDSGSSQWTSHADPDDSTKRARLDNGDTAPSGGYGAQYVLTGPGEVRFYVANYGASTAITMRVRSAESR